MPLIKRGAPRSPDASPTATPGSPAQLLASGSISERWAAARALGQDPNAVPALAAALSGEAAPEVREAIFTSLLLIRTPVAAEALTAILRSDDAQLRTGALDALAAMVDVARPLLVGLLGDRDPDIRLLSCELARWLEPQEATDLLCIALESEGEANVCAAAVDVLSEMGTSSATDALQRCAARFQNELFLTFAISDAIERVSKRPALNE